MAAGQKNGVQTQELLVSETRTTTIMAKEGDGRSRPEIVSETKTRIIFADSDDHKEVEKQLHACEKCSSQNDNGFSKKATDDGREIITGTKTTVGELIETLDLKFETTTLTLMAKDFDQRGGNGGGS